MFRPLVALTIYGAEVLALAFTLENKPKTEKAIKTVVKKIENTLDIKK